MNNGVRAACKTLLRTPGCENLQTLRFRNMVKITEFGDGVLVPILGAIDPHTMRRKYHFVNVSSPCH